MVEKSSRVQKYILFLLLFFIIALISVNLILEREDLRKKITSVFEPKPGSCLILEEKYCKEVKIIPHPTKENTFIAVADLPEGTPVFSSVDGYYSESTYNLKNEDGTLTMYPALVILVSKDRTFDKAEGSHGYVSFFEKIPEKDEVKKGDKIGEISSNKKIDKIGDYNLMYSVTKYVREENSNQIQFVNDYNFLKTLFIAN